MTPRSKTHRFGRARLSALLAVAVVGLTACGGATDVSAGSADAESGDTDTTPEVDDEADTDTAPEAGEESDGAEMAPGTEDKGAGSISVAETEVGAALVDENGMSLYLFEPDEAGPSTCYEGCAQAWPPLQGPVEAGADVDASMLDTIEREDGSMQATYAGWPLYYYASDEASGDIAGQGIEEVWWLVSPDGDAIRTEPGADPPAGSAIPGY